MNFGIESIKGEHFNLYLGCGNYKKKAMNHKPGSVAKNYGFLALESPLETPVQAPCWDPD